MRVFLKGLCFGVPTAALLALTGCGMGIVNSSVSDPASTASYTLKGSVKLPGSGQATAAIAHPNAAIPVSGATVYLYAAGVSGYGSAATLLARTTTSTDGSGSFSFTQDNGHVNNLSNISNSYRCPTYTFTSADGTATVNKDSFIYLVAVGGDTQDGTGTAHTNTGNVMMAALGDCQQLAINEPFVNINEVTTIASVYSLAPYISPIYPTATINGVSTVLPGGALGTSSSYTTQYGIATQGGLGSGGASDNIASAPVGYNALANAFGTVRKLVDINNGTATSSLNLTANGVTVTATPETAKVNHLADILSTCVDSSNSGSSLSTQCSTLFSYTVPPISSASTSLGSGVTFPAATDTLQAAYYLATNPTSNTSYGASTSSSTSNLGHLYSLVGSMADFQPTLSAQPTDWTLGIAYSSTSTCGNDATPGAFIGGNAGSLASDLFGNVYLLNGSSTGNTLVAISPAGAPTTCQFGQLTNASSLSLDVNGNAWLIGNGNIYRSNFAGTNTLWSPSNGTNAFTPAAVIPDGYGNIFYSVSSGGLLEEFVGAQTLSAAVIPSVEAGNPITSAGTMVNLNALATDATGNIFSAPNDNSGITYGWARSGFNYITTTINTSSLVRNPVSVAISSANHLLLGGTCCSGTTANTIASLTLSGAGGSLTAGSPTASNAGAGGVNGAPSLAVDGAGNVWSGLSYAPATYTSGSNTYGLFGVAELNSSLQPLSPSATGSSCSAGLVNTGCNIGGSFQKTSLGVGTGITIDISGNVWVAANRSSNSQLGQIVELVGAAVPTIQPLSVAARDLKVGQKP